MRVAVVGGGPKGLFAVERLLAHRCDEPLWITVFDPRPPGQGAAYDVNQPSWLRLNVSAGIVDAGWRTGPRPSPEWLVPFDQWRGADRTVPPADHFPPRAMVGRYLQWVWAGLVDRAPSDIRLEHRPVTVGAIEPETTGWSVDGEVQDEVLLATGHAMDWPGALRHRWRGGERLVGAVYPVDGLAAIGPGESVAVRGAALTFIDAALALTEGRGGRFGGAAGLRYRPSGAEPRLIWPTSRSGHWMTAKPDPGSRLAAVERSALVRSGSARVALADSAESALSVVPALADQLLHLVGVDDHDGMLEVYRGVPSGDATDNLRRSWEVATDRRRPDAAWAVGQAWRDLYPALMERFAGLDPAAGFGAFLDVARRLERVAFGPPPVNAAKLLALLEVGVVDPSSLGSAVVTSSGFRWKDGVGQPADAVVDAVLPPPGAGPVAGSLPGELVASGLLGVPEGRRGLAVDRDGTCLSMTGQRLEGLAAIGRPTEDVTIGNDTLSRRQQVATELWAARVTDRLGAAR